MGGNTMNIIQDKPPQWPKGFQTSLPKSLKSISRVFTDRERTSSQSEIALKNMFNSVTSIIKTAKSEAHAADPFCKRFHNSSLYRNFAEWYSERQPDDREFKSIY